MRRCAVKMMHGQALGHHNRAHTTSSSEEDEVASIGGNSLWSASHQLKCKSTKDWNRGVYKPILEYLLYESDLTRFILVTRHWANGNPLNQRDLKQYTLVTRPPGGPVELAIISREELAHYGAEPIKDCTTVIDQLFMGVWTEGNPHKDITRDARAVYAVYHPHLMDQFRTGTHKSSLEYTLVSARQIIPDMTEHDRSLLGTALALANFNMNNLYDTRIGVRTEMLNQGRKRTYKAMGRDNSVYPRVDPVAMCLIESPDQLSLLLVSNRRRRKINYYAPVSGFVELGESVEDAAMREALEETGVMVKNPRLIKSQPWVLSMNGVHPQIILGFLATAASLKVDMQDDENRSARWFSVPEVGQLLQNSTKKNKSAQSPTADEIKAENDMTPGEREAKRDEIPCQIAAPYALSHQLVQHWYTSKTAKKAKKPFERESESKHEFQEKKRQNT